MTLPVLDTGGGVAGGVAGGGVVDEGVTTGVDGCSNEANPALIWTKRAIEGERLTFACPELAAAVNGATAARLRDGAGVAPAPKGDIERGGVAIGTIGRPLTDAGMLLGVLSRTAEGKAAEGLAADDSLELILGVGVGSEAKGASTAGGSGFFINLWWSVNDAGAWTKGGAAAIGREGGAEGSGRTASAKAGAAGR